MNTEKVARAAWGVGGIAVVLVAWGVLSATLLRGVGGRDIGLGVFPGPQDILAGMIRDGWGFYARNVGLTANEAMQGFLWGNLIAAVLSALVILIPAVTSVVTTTAVIVHCIPAVAIAPIIYVLIGPPSLNQPSGPAIFLAALFVFFAALMSTLASIARADRVALDVVEVFGGGRLQKLRNVQVVAALPGFLAALKIGAPAALLGAILGEYIGGVDRGVGPALMNAQQNMDVERVWGLCVATGLVAGCLFFVFAMIEWLALPWARGARQS